MPIEPIDSRLRPLRTNEAHQTVDTTPRGSRPVLIQSHGKHTVIKHLTCRCKRSPMGGPPAEKLTEGLEKRLLLIRCQVSIRSVHP